MSSTIPDRLAHWVLTQPVFFVATAPLDREGFVNCSPKGLTGSFVVIDESTVAYLDLTGSGIETVAHVRENSRIVIMFCAFEGKPNIVRFYGKARVVAADCDEFPDLAKRFPSRPGIRSIIVIDVVRVSESCGFGVPLMEYVGDRDLLVRDAEKKGPEKLASYRLEKNATSIDGLPGLI